MKLPFAILLAVAGTAMTAGAAEARQGCGPRAERYHGRCISVRGHHRYDRWDRGHRNDRWVVGRYYNGRGYWNGQRWYQNRYRHNNGWRYR